MNPASDHICLGKKALRLEQKRIYLMINKPRQVLTTLSDPEGRPTIADYLQEIPERIFPVGRLDWDSEGLLLLTNDGDFANQIIHPKHGIEKTYFVKLNQAPTSEAIAKLLRGVTIPGGKVKADLVEKIRRGEDQHPWYKVIIHEGKNRQIRKMFEKVSLDVMKIQRVAIGQLHLGTLNRGEIRHLRPQDLEKIFLSSIEFVEKPKRKTSVKRRIK